MFKCDKVFCLVNLTQVSSTIFTCKYKITYIFPKHLLIELAQISFELSPVMFEFDLESDYSSGSSSAAYCLLVNNEQSQFSSLTQIRIRLCSLQLIFSSFSVVFKFIPIVSCDSKQFVELLCVPWHIPYIVMAKKTK